MKSVIFTAPVKADSVEWTKDNPELYDKKLTAYKDTPSKARLWTEKSVELNTECKFLQTWYSKHVNPIQQTHQTEVRRCNPGVD